MKATLATVKTPGTPRTWLQRDVLVATCLLIIGLYVYLARSGYFESLKLNPADAYYNLLVQGFQAGQLNLKKDVPPGLSQLPDPYDPAANLVYLSPPHELLDISYYAGKLYLYWGVTPALLLFWPYAALTGEYLLHKHAVVIFCALGFLASVGLLRALQRRYFPEIGNGVMLASVIALGLATGLPIILSRAEVYEVPVSCGYMLVMLTLAAVWCAGHEPGWRIWWLVAASAAYGLAVAARPSLLFGAVILAIPVIQARRERARLWPVIAAAVCPIALIGAGLMLYNMMRFDDPLEFGARYQLAPIRQERFFGLEFLWFNLRIYFLEPVRWCARFPFVREIATPPFPAGYAGAQSPFGVLTNVPVVWLAALAPLAWRGRSGQERAGLTGWTAAVTLLFGVCVLTLGVFHAASMRYEVEFLPALVWLAVIGIFGLERTLAGQPTWRRLARGGWGLLLGFSVAFNLLAAVVHHGEGHCFLGNALAREGRLPEAIGHYEQALRLKPEFAEAHYNLGLALQQTGKIQEAISHFEQALRFRPDFVDPHFNLGIALLQSDRVQEAIAHLETSVRANPASAEARFSLGLALARTGRTEDAIAQFEDALRINPHLAKAHYSLGSALQLRGRYAEAIDAFRRGLEIEPRDVVMGNAMAWLMATAPDPAVRNAAQAIQIGERLAELTGRREPRPLDTLAAAYAEAGRFEEAAATAREAAALAEAQGLMTLAADIKTRAALYENSQPYRLPTR